MVKKDRPRILFIAPLPPPVNGQSLASKILLQELSRSAEVVTVDTRKPRPRNLIDRLARLFAVARMLVQITASVRKADLIYLTISESFLGNIKDLAIYALCYSRLNRLTIHLHGGANMAKLMAAPYSPLAYWNRHIFRRLRAVVILGETHVSTFRGSVPPDRLFLVPNFAEDSLFVSPAAITEKFSQEKLRVLFLSNMLPGKGYRELLEAWSALPSNVRDRVSLDLAGAPTSQEWAQTFETEIRHVHGATYHGAVTGEDKRKLFESAHIFCLPTYYAFEGQPISILEAYASGCVVLTTDHSGIRDIFRHGVNGYQVDKRSAASLTSALTDAVSERSGLCDIALFNSSCARANFTVSRYLTSLTGVLRLGTEPLSSQQVDE